MQIFSMIAVILVFAFSILQCDKTSLKSEANVAQTNTNTSSTIAPADDAPRISLDDAKKSFDAGGAIFIDTRAESQYKEEHIKGAINIQAEAVETRYAELSKDKKIIAYCS